jgi:hypothetical protein
MLKKMLPLRELMISATARTVQTLARWAAKPSRKASAIAKTRVPISNLSESHCAESGKFNVM